jgi:hypothetical protein
MITATQHRNRAKLLLQKAMTAPKATQRLMRQRAVVHVMLAIALEREAASADRPTLH